MSYVKQEENLFWLISRCDPAMLEAQVSFRDIDSPYVPGFVTKLSAQYYGIHVIL
jgi:hypothetical protein